MIFKTQELIDAGLPQSAVQDDIIGTSRCQILHKIVFEWEDGKHYSAAYRVNVAGMTVELPWDNEEIVECQEVEQKEVIKLVWVVKVFEVENESN